MKLALNRLMAVALLCSSPTLALANDTVIEHSNLSEPSAVETNVEQASSTDADYLPDMSKLESKLREDFYDANSALWEKIEETNRSLDALIERVDDLISDTSETEE